MSEKAMNADNKVPFYSNTPDDTHCFQAALRMVLKYFQPEKDYSWKKLDQVTKKQKGMWTWAMAGLVWMKNQGYEVKDIEVFDYKEFAKHPKAYLITTYGKKAANEMIKNSRITQEIKYANELLKEKVVTKMIPTFETIAELLKKGYLIICQVNSSKLANRKGYIGHFVVVKGIEGDNLVIHDPGLPPMKNRKVGFIDFESAWADPNEKAKNILAFRHI